MKGGRARRGPLSPLSSSVALLGPVAAVPSLQWECRFIASGCKLAHHVVRSGQVRFITRPKSRTMRAKRKINVLEPTERGAETGNELDARLAVQ